MTVKLWSGEQCELGEGVRWVGARLVFVDLLAGRLLQTDGVNPTPAREIVRLPIPLGAVAPVQEKTGSWVAAAGTGVWLLDPDEAPRHVADLDASPETNRVNDAVADPRGRLWIGTMTYAATPNSGRLYRWHPATGPVVMLDGLTIPNGPAFDSTGSVMYFADTAIGRIYRSTLDAEGQLTDRQIFAQIDSADGAPDGMTVDTAGNLWVALWGGSAVRRYRPDGVLDRHVLLPARQPTSVCLGGPDLRTLFITSASYGLAQPGRYDGALLAIEADTPGTPAAAVQRPAYA